MKQRAQHAFQLRRGKRQFRVIRGLDELAAGRSKSRITSVCAVRGLCRRLAGKMPTACRLATGAHNDKSERSILRFCGLESESNEDGRAPPIFPISAGSIPVSRAAAGSACAWDRVAFSPPCTPPADPPPFHRLASSTGRSWKAAHAAGRNSARFRHR